jgi:hypothetical protein
MNERVNDKWPEWFNAKADDALMKGIALAAIEKAERYGTKLVIKENGKIKELTPAQMRRRLAKKK